MLTDSRVRFFIPIAISLGMVFSAGCASDSPAENPAKSIATPPDYPVTMAGTEQFAEGSLMVRVTLGLAIGQRPDKENGERKSGADNPSHHGGGHHHGGGDNGSERPTAAVSGENNPQPVAMGSTLPPAQLKIYLKNTSTTAPISCEVVDFKSDLGDFAVFPSRYQIESGQSAASEIMTSRLGVKGSEIPVTVELRIHGRVEKKIVTLYLLPKPDRPPRSTAR